jgi:hypothetical protein
MYEQNMFANERGKDSVMAENVVDHKIEERLRKDYNINVGESWAYGI